MEVSIAILFFVAVVCLIYIFVDGLTKWYYDDDFTTDDELDEAEDYFDPLDTVGELMYRVQKVDHLMHTP